MFLGKLVIFSYLLTNRWLEQSLNPENHSQIYEKPSHCKIKAISLLYIIYILGYNLNMIIITAAI